MTDSLPPWSRSPWRPSQHELQGIYENLCAVHDGIQTLWQELEDRAEELASSEDECVSADQVAALEEEVTHLTEIEKQSTTLRLTFAIWMAVEKEKDGAETGIETKGQERTRP